MLTPTFVEDQDQKDNEAVTDITFCAIIRIPANVNIWKKGVIIGNYGKNTHAIQFEVEGDGTLQIWWNGEAHCSGTSDLRDGKTHIVTGCRDATLSTLSVYVDGIKEKQIVQKLQNLKIEHQLLIGKDYEGEQRVFKGDILKYYVYQCSFTDHKYIKLYKNGELQINHSHNI
eukprot:455333_1